MAITQINSFKNGDNTMTNVINTLDKAIIGHMACSLDSLTTTTQPKIAAGSSIEYNGDLYLNDAEYTITSAVTSTTAPNYIYFNGTNFKIQSASPTWDTAKQGWYNAAYGRALPFTFRYDGANFYEKQMHLFHQGSQPIHVAEDATERTNSSTSWVNETNMTLTFSTQSDYDLWEIIMVADIKTSASFMRFGISQTVGAGRLSMVSQLPALPTSELSLYTTSTSYETKFMKCILYGGGGGTTQTFQMRWQQYSLGTGYVRNRRILARRLNGDQ